MKTNCQPRYRYRSHYNVGQNNPNWRKPRSKETQRKLDLAFNAGARQKIKAAKLANLNPMWKGDNVGLYALHDWVRNHLPQPDLCQDCRIVPPYDLANITGIYSRDFDNWKYLCRRCHMKRDTRLRDPTTGRFIKN